MAYVQDLPDTLIRSMSPGELVHTMMTNFDPQRCSPNALDDGVFLQNQNYFRAAERLDEILHAAVVK